MEKKQAFEKDAEMTEYILEMAHTGRSPQEWTSFVSKINLYLLLILIATISTLCILFNNSIRLFIT